MADYLSVGPEPIRLQVISEPYVVLTARGYAPVIDVLTKGSKAPQMLFISAQSLWRPLEMMRQENEGRFTGLEFWIRKQSYDRSSPYVVEDE